jgi:hypothetical protein
MVIIFSWHPPSISSVATSRISGCARPAILVRLFGGRCGSTQASARSPGTRRAIVLRASFVPKTPCADRAPVEAPTIGYQDVVPVIAAAKNQVAEPRHGGRRQNAISQPDVERMAGPCRRASGRPVLQRDDTRADHSAEDCSPQCRVPNRSESGDHQGCCLAGYRLRTRTSDREGACLARRDRRRWVAWTSPPDVPMRA